MLASPDGLLIDLRGRCEDIAEDADAGGGVDQVPLISKGDGDFIQQGFILLFLILHWLFGIAVCTTYIF